MKINIESSQFLKGITFSENQVHEEKNETYFEYFISGNIWESADYINGYFHGARKMNFSSGELVREELYYYNEHDGICTNYREVGKKEKTISYKIVTRYGKPEQYADQGKLKKIIIY